MMKKGYHKMPDGSMMKNSDMKQKRAKKSSAKKATAKPKTIGTGPNKAEVTPMYPAKVKGLPKTGRQNVKKTQKRGLFGGMY